MDANVSVHREGEPLGVRSEVKNIGSIRAVAHAVKYEIDRQVRTLESGGVVVNETRAWDTDSRQTVPMRDKEEKQVTILITELHLSINNSNLFFPAHTYLMCTVFMIVYIRYLKHITKNEIVSVI